jgi:hypothetical protein
VAAKTDVPLSQLYSVVTFYALFNLDPQGDLPPGEDWDAFLQGISSLGGAEGAAGAILG